MNLIQLIACIGLITGCFVLLHISPMDFTEGVFRRITSKPKSIRSEVNESTRRKKKSFLRREIEETQTILRMTGRAAKFPMVCALSLLLFLVGAAFALTLGNLFLVPVLAVGMMFVPFWFIRLTANHYKKNIAAELETALSIITTAYLRNEDIQTAVEENIDYDPTQGIRIVHRSKEKSWRQIKVFHDVEQLPERGHRNSIGDASDVGAALSKLQAHPMLRNALLFPQLCDAVPHKRFIAAVIVHDPLPPISTYYFNIRERRGFALKSSTFASHNE